MSTEAQPRDPEAPSAFEASLLERLAAGLTPPRERAPALIIVTISVAFCLFHLFSAFFGQPMSYVFLTSHLAFMMVLTFLLRPLGSIYGTALEKIGFAVDLVLMAVVIGIQFYILVDPFKFVSRRGAEDPLDLALGVVMILLVMETTRRVVGVVMSVLAVFFMLQSAYGEYFPGIFFGPNVDWSLIINDLFLEEEGIYSAPIAVSASFVVLFIIFGAFLMRSGVGDLFRDVAFATMGRRIGGPAKAAVLSSAFMASISGSAVSNVVTTGTFTIPLMKRMGYPARFAGAVEACASTGGVFTPPVMGAVAFIMAEFMGVPYWSIVIAAAIPAALYFAAIFAAVHFRACRLSLQPETAESLPSIRAALIDKGHMLIPLLLLVGALMIGFSPAYSALTGIGAVFLCSFARPATRLTPLTLIATLEDAARMMVYVAIPSAAAGLIIGSIYFSGLAVRFASSIVDMAGGLETPALMLAMVVCLVLGMGVTVTALYILVAALIVPALIRLGVEPISAHLFAFHFGVHSYITPPVALSAFAAAAIARTGPMTTALESARLAAPAYLIPYMFVFSPALVGVGDWSEILLDSAAALLGVIAVAAAIEGYLLRRMALLERALTLGAALLLVAPGYWSHGVGFLGLLLIVALQRRAAGEAVKP